MKKPAAACQITRKRSMHEGPADSQTMKKPAATPTKQLAAQQVTPMAADKTDTEAAGSPSPDMKTPIKKDSISKTMITRHVDKPDTK
eukprot:9153702-Pyramimonas_sp.AAC.1